MSLFKSDADRELWIKLNAERQIEWEKSLTWFNKETGKYEPTRQALNPRSMEAALEVARNQCEYDEKNGELRYTLEQLITLDVEGFKEIDQKRHQIWINKFESLE